MSSTSIYILVAIIVLAIVATVRVWVGHKTAQKLSTLSALSFGLIVAGIVFGENHLLGYCLIGAGVLLAIIDIVIKIRSNNER